ncbi:MAG: hypothetical protein GY861_06900 [bacterium]|nr:hypothetical protein [bacterium]
MIKNERANGGVEMERPSLGMFFLVFIVIAGGVACLFASTSYVVTAANATPVGADDIITVNSTRGIIGTSGAVIPAEAGNVTELDIDAIVITESWQGYFGIINGTVTLDDADNNTMYDWEMAAPQGEIYASNTSGVNWETINCMNVSNYEAGPGFDTMFNVTIIEEFYGINTTDYDGVDQTFNETFGGTFQVANTEFDAISKCAQANTYVDQVYQREDFVELLLTDNDSSLVFATVLNNSIDGFKQSDEQYDFQLMVLENGRAGFEATTPYYFYVELS